MTRKEIEALNNEIITEEQYDEIELHEDVSNIECLGESSSHVGYEWFSVEFSDGKSIDVFGRFYD